MEETTSRPRGEKYSGARTHIEQYEQDPDGLASLTQSGRRGATSEGLIAWLVARDYEICVLSENLQVAFMLHLNKRMR